MKQLLEKIKNFFDTPSTEQEPVAWMFQHDETNFRVDRTESKTTV